MTSVTPLAKAFFVIVGLSALWVGSWTYFDPANVQYGIPWSAPPLHSRFIGSIYLSAAAFCFSGALSRSLSEVRVLPVMIALWTGVVFIMSLVYLEAPDYRRAPIWIWLIAYLVYPLIALWLAWIYRKESGRAKGEPLPAWLRSYLLGQGVLVSLIAALLFLAPEQASGIWPWRLTPLLAQLYAGPLLCYGIASLMLSKGDTYSEARVFAAGAVVLAVLTLMASFIHRTTFTGGISVVIWVLVFVIIAVVHGFVLFRGLERKTG